LAETVVVASDCSVKEAVGPYGALAEAVEQTVPKTQETKMEAKTARLAEPMVAAAAVPGNAELLVGAFREMAALAQFVSYGPETRAAFHQPAPAIFNPEQP